MVTTDVRGLRLTGANDAAAGHYEKSVTELQCYRGDPVASIDAALAEAPAFVMAHAMKAWLHLLGTEPSGIAVAKECHAAAMACASGATARELGHLKAIALMADGHFLDAGRVMEDVTIGEPLDALGLLAGHQIDFFSGHSRMLRDRIARAMPYWSESVPGYHSILGMHAFGLEEMGDYTQAEIEGRRGVELEARDGWSQHAVAHVLEMQGRAQEGIAWMTGNRDGWAGDSFLQVHNWWHLTLYHLDESDFSAALGVFDDAMAGGTSPVVLDMVDASSFLWRLALRNVAVGDRWKTIAAGWEQALAPGYYTFNDLHAVMAFASAGQRDRAVEVIEQQHAVIQQAKGTRLDCEIGQAIAKGILAFSDGDYRGALSFLRPARSTAYMFGGSHAQRDVIDLTMIEAAVRVGDKPLAMALTTERLSVKPLSPLARKLAQ